MPLSRSNEWKRDIFEYLVNGKLLENEKEAKRLKHRANWFLVHGLFYNTLFYISPLKMYVYHSKMEAKYFDKSTKEHVEAIWELEQLQVKHFELGTIGRRSLMILNS